MATSPSAASAAAQIGIQDFLKILVAQLGNQDPLKPMDNQEFVTQLAQFTSLQQTQEMNDKLSSLLSAQTSASSVGLLGRVITASTNNGTVSGTVTALSYTGQEPSFSIKTADGSTLTGINFGQIIGVRSSAP
ncbi:flagellar hook assembly protein FlgD [Roseateles sp. DB2]|uniref:flagellar hook assembly protein FlgD n=1 Tax=Roseateles sp. DB2 TaxID=3453717 RepID=UPI003EE8AFB5